jgi:hypothetical protein
LNAVAFKGPQKRPAFLPVIKLHEAILTAIRKNDKIIHSRLFYSGDFLRKFDRKGLKGLQMRPLSDPHLRSDSGSLIENLPGVSPGEIFCRSLSELRSLHSCYCEASVFTQE